MKKQIFLIVASTTLLLLSAFTLIQNAGAQSDFNAFSGNEIADNQIDGTIGNEWDDAGHVSDVALNPQGTADVWTKNDGNFLYIAVRFTADSNDPWMGIQLGGSSCMESGADLALFGNNDTQFNPTGYKDCHLAGAGAARVDATQNGIGALNITPQNVVSVELKKPLNSGDTAGKDINWAMNETKTMVMIWDSNGRGSSGGNTNHYGNGATVDTPKVRTLVINSNTLSEGGNPSQDGNPILGNLDTTTAIIALVIVIVAVLAIIFGVIRVRKRNAGKQPKAQ